MLRSSTLSPTQHRRKQQTLLPSYSQRVHELRAYLTLKGLDYLYSLFTASVLQEGLDDITAKRNVHKHRDVRQQLAHHSFKVGWPGYAQFLWTRAGVYKFGLKSWAFNASWDFVSSKQKSVTAHLKEEVGAKCALDQRQE